MPIGDTVWFGLVGACIKVLSSAFSNSLTTGGRISGSLLIQAEDTFENSVVPLLSKKKEVRWPWKKPMKIG